MSVTSQVRPEPHDEDIDPQLSAVVCAILDGSSVDWRACSDGVSGTFEEELKIVAGVVDVHRSLGIDLPPAAGASIPPELPRQSGHLIIKSFLGKGAYGEVFLAWDTQLHRDVALKLLFRNSGASAGADPFLDEGRLLARVRHPHVVTVYGAERIDGRLGLLTEFINGRSLAAVVAEEGPLPVHAIVSIGIDLCRALEAVHAAGLIHRDIKAQNVMQEARGRIVLMDFGAGSLATATDRAHFAGTPLYLAPEVLAGSAASVQSDLYSLGVLLHFLAVRSYPVTGRSLDEIRAAHQAGKRIQLATLNTRLPPYVTHAIDRATSSDPRVRFESAADLRDALERPGGWRQVWKLPALAAALVLFAGIGVFVSSQGGSALPNAGTPPTAPTSVTLAPYVHLGGPTRNGDYHVFVDADRNIQIRHPESGVSRIAIASGFADGVIEAALASAEGRRIVFLQRRRHTAQVEVRMAGIGLAWPQIIEQPRMGAPILTLPPGTIAHFLNSSADDRAVLMMTHTPGASVNLLLVPLNGGAPRILRTFDAARPRRASLSPDGRFVVYDFPADGISGQRDLMIGRTEHPAEHTTLLEGPSDDSLPIWTADGSRVLFSSNRSGQIDGWGITVSEGHTTSPPKRFATGMAGVIPIATTVDGAYHYHWRSQREEAHAVELNADGVAQLPPRGLHPDPGESRRYPVWSHDGRFVAYVVVEGRGVEDFGSYLRVLDWRTRQTRDIYPQLRFLGPHRISWSPDDTRLLVQGLGLDGYWGLFAVDAETGATTTIVRSKQPPSDSIGSAFDWGCAPDTVIFSRRGGAIVERHLRTGTERLLFSVTSQDWVSGIGCSADGAKIGFSTWNSEEKRSVLGVLTESGAATEIVRLHEQGAIAFKQWIGADRLLHTLTSPQGRRVGSIPTGGGNRIDSGVIIPTEAHGASLQPGGNVLVYSTGATAWTPRILTDVVR